MATWEGLATVGFLKALFIAAGPGHGSYSVRLAGRKGNFTTTLGFFVG